MDEATEFELFPGSRRLEAKVRGIPHAAWPFIILAALVLAVLVGASGPQFTRSTLLLIADNVGWALLPAAVLIGCPTAWRSARPILVGAIAASTIGAVAELIWTLPVMVGGTSWMSSGRMTFSLLGAIGTIAGIAVFAATLERRRGTSTTWPLGLVALAVAGTAAACLYEGSTWLNWYNSQLSFIVQDKLAEQIMVLE